MLSTRDIVFGIGLPVVWSAFVLLVAWRPWRGQVPQRAGEWGGPVALAGSLIGAFVGIQAGWPKLPPREVAEWLPVIAMGTGLVGLADSVWQIPRMLRTIAACVCIAISIWLLLGRLPAETMGLGPKLAWLIALAAVVSLCWFDADAMARECPGVAVPRDLFIVATASSLVLMMSGSSLFGQLGGSLAASLGVFFVLAFFSRISLARGTVLMFATLNAGLLVCGHFYASLTGTNAFLLVIAALMTGAGRFWPLRLLSGWKQHAVQMILVGVPAGVAVALAAAAFAQAMSESGYAH